MEIDNKYLEIMNSNLEKLRIEISDLDRKIESISDELGDRIDSLDSDMSCASDYFTESEKLDEEISDIVYLINKNHESTTTNREKLKDSNAILDKRINDISELISRIQHKIIYLEMEMRKND